MPSGSCASRTGHADSAVRSKLYVRNVAESMVRRCWRWESTRSGREWLGRVEWASTHKGFRPKDCESIAFTSFATPAPESAANRDKPEDQDARRHTRCRAAIEDGNRWAATCHQNHASGGEKRRTFRVRLVGRATTARSSSNGVEKEDVIWIRNRWYRHPGGRSLG